MKKSDAIIKRDKKIISQSIVRDASFVFKKGKGCWLWDVEGKKYLDFNSAIAVLALGHANKEIEKAIKQQLPYGTHCAFPDFYAELPVKFSETLLSLVPKKFNNVFLSNSGTESIECAIKAAKWHSKKNHLIAFSPCFHGRTMGSLSMTNAKKVFTEDFGPLLPVKHVTYPYPYRMGNCTNQCLDELEKTMKIIEGDIAGVFMEPIAGEPGYVVPPKDWVKGVRKLCDDYDALLVSDEVQAGCFRTGKFWAIENFGVEPDIVSMSKAVGGGLPLGVTITRKEIFDWPAGAHSNTFGGNLISCASGIATLNYMKKKKLGQNAVKIGNHMMKRLSEMKEKYEFIGDVRGIGLMIGVEIIKNKHTKEMDIKKRDEIVLKAEKNGLAMLPAGKNVIRIAPPLIITKKEADIGLNILEKSMKQAI